MITPPGARCWAELDLEAIRENVTTIRDTAGVPLLAVVKSDGYGHGAPWVARAAVEAGACGVAVATPSEAKALRDAGITAPIQVLGSFLPGELPTAVEASATLSVHEPQDLIRIRDAAWKAGRALPVHIMVDVGMHRHGLSPSGAFDLLRRAKRDPGIRIEGLMTHLPCAADEDLSVSHGQVAAFAHLVSKAARHGLLPRKVHAAASAALFRLPESRFNQVRSGIAVVGLDPHGRLAAAGATLAPALSIRAKVMRTRRVKAGESVGYGARWQAPRDSRLAIVGMGYGDGFPYPLTGKQAEMLVHGTRCPVVGTVMMDYVLLDVTHVSRRVRTDDVATFIGRDGLGVIPLEEQSTKAGMIPYALACGLGGRLQRVTANVQSAPVAWTPRLVA